MGGDVTRSGRVSMKIQRRFLESAGVADAIKLKGIKEFSVFSCGHVDWMKKRSEQDGTHTLTTNSACMAIFFIYIFLLYISSCPYSLIL